MVRILARRKIFLSTKTFEWNSNPPSEPVPPWNRRDSPVGRAGAGGESRPLGPGFIPRQGSLVAKKRVARNLPHAGTGGRSWENKSYESGPLQQLFHDTREQVSVQV